MTALVCGSFAYDTIMVFPDHFKNHILADKVHMINVSFLVPEMRREFGGCAGNITYNLNLLGADVVPLGTVGTDFGPYHDWFKQNQIDLQFVTTIANSFTAQAFITTDLDDNQITAFHPGAMSESHNNQVTDVSDISIGIISPDGKQGMIEHANQFVDCNVPFIFDPGQGMPMFNGDELMKFIGQATWLTLNDYEAQLMQDKTGLTLEQIQGQVEALIITKGGDGSVIYTKDNEYFIRAAKPEKVVDPTGCGDAYRSGLIYGLMNNLDWQTTGKIASLMGAIKIAYHGTQNHSHKLDDIKQLYQQQYGDAFPV